MGPNCESNKLICPRRDFLEAENKMLNARLKDCEMSLARWDDGQDSEYWLHYPMCRAAELEPSK